MPDVPNLVSECATKRASMVAKLRGQGIRDENVLRAMGILPRHRFVAPLLRAQAYADHPVGIGHGQTISQPFIVASMLQHAAPMPGEVALEVGGGSGYMAALLAQFCVRVIAVERVPQLVQQAQQNLQDVGIENVEVAIGDGSIGWEAEAPFDVIIVSAAAPSIPQPLEDQLQDGGRMVIPVGGLMDQTMMLIMKKGKETSSRVLYGCKFVPLVGEAGFHAQNE